MAIFHEPYAQWLRATAPWIRGRLEYLFLLNAVIYFLLDRRCDRLTGGVIPENCYVNDSPLLFAAGSAKPLRFLPVSF